MNKVHELNYEPGEVRCNVDYKSVNSLASQSPSQSYLEIIKRGQEHLRDLREHPDEKRNIKDLKYDEEVEAEQKKKKADATRMKNEVVMQQNKNKGIEESKEFNNSLSMEVGLGATVLIAGGIVVAASTGSSSEEVDETVFDEPSNQTSSEWKGTLSTNDSTEDVKLPEDTLMTQQSDQTKVDFTANALLESAIERASSINNSPKLDFEYDDVWLGTITEILNEEDATEGEP